MVEEFGEEDHAAVIVEGRDQNPFLFGGGGKEVDGGIMLDEFAGVAGQHFAVMGGAFRFLEIEAIFLGAVNDGWHGNGLIVGGL